MSLTLLVATIGSGMGAQLGAARLLYGMGRSSAMPKKFFGAIDPTHPNPAPTTCLFVGAIALIGALLSVQLRQWRANAEFRRADRFHGSESGGAHPVLRSWAERSSGN